MSTPLIPCSAQVLSSNNAQTIGACLESLRCFAEVIVLDGNSTDGTREIVQKFPNVRLVNQPAHLLNAQGHITHFGDMRNVGVEASTYPWIFQLDSDEIATEALVEEIGCIVQKNIPGVFRASRRFVVNGERIERCAGYPVYQHRLFHRSASPGYGKSIHERILLNPGVTLQTLQGEFLSPLPPPQELEAKYRRYLEMEVERLGTLSWSQWCNWILFRNLRSALGLSVLVFLTWVTPGKGKRMPFLYDWQAVRHSLRTIVATVPWRQKLKDKS